MVAYLVCRSEKTKGRAKVVGAGVARGVEMRSGEQQGSKEGWVGQVLPGVVMGNHVYPRWQD